MGRPALRALAERLGIAGDYVAQTGERCTVSDATREALIAALGLDASRESSAREALAALDAAERTRRIEPVEVVRAGSAASRQLRVRAPAGGRTAWSVDLIDESGGRWQREGVGAARGGTLIVSLPAPERRGLAAGYWEVELEVEGERLRQRRIAALPTCTGVRERLGARRALGLWAQLPLLRGAADRGWGELGTLRELVERAAPEGIDFIGLEPLHARLPPSQSPYAPLSRLFRDPLYLDPASIPELRQCEAARAQLESPRVQEGFARLRTGEHVDRPRAWALISGPLAALHAAAGARSAAYASFRAQGGELLERFATYCALAEALGSFDHRSWPAEYREPGHAQVAAFSREHAARVDFHAWIQFEVERQLGAAARAARDAGMRIGLYADLAVGSAPGGFDVWAFPGLFATGARIGCPPDFYSRQGQDWGLPPLHPHRLRESAFAYWIALLRASFAHAGALRIDHAMGLRRLFWIPTGRRAREGAYVRYPERELRAILALESRRAGALVIGEDLGTVPAGFSASLARERILSTRLVYFEQRGGRFRAARGYAPHALVCVRNHDLPPLRAWLEARDLELRHAAGALPLSALRAARRQRKLEVEGLRRRLQSEGLLGDASDAGAEALGVALAGFAARTPAPLVALGLDDLAGEHEPINVPGLPESVYPSWARRMRHDLRSTFALPAARDALALARRERAARRSR